jgi:hypothetical protein
MNEVRSFVGFDEMCEHLNAVEDSLPYGGVATIALLSSNPVTQSELDKMVYDSVNQGFHLAGNVTVTQTNGNYLMKIPLYKGSPQWAALISFIPLIFAGGLLAYWLISGKAEEFIRQAIIPLLLVGGGMTLLIILATRYPFGAKKTS